MFTANEFYTKIRRRNKEKFIEIVSKAMAEQSQSGDVNLPVFIDAQNYKKQANESYEQFKEAGLIDCYGYLVEIGEQDV